jgi:plastocyanin domain-containing protein
MKWARHVERTGETRSTYSFLTGNLKGRENVEDLSADGELHTHTHTSFSKRLSTMQLSAKQLIM